MKIYKCDPAKGRRQCSKPERFCGIYCTMTYNSRWAADDRPLPLSLEEVEAENDRIRKKYEEDRRSGK